MNKNIAVAGVALVICACGDSTDVSAGSEDAALRAVSKDRIYAHIAYLADDALEGRLTGEPGFDKAAQYVADRFAEIGLEPGGNEGWYQQVPLRSYLIDTENVSLVVHRDTGDTKFTYRDEYVVYGDKVRGENSVRGELVYVGYGVHAPEYGYSDYRDIDVAAGELEGRR